MGPGFIFEVIAGEPATYHTFGSIYRQLVCPGLRSALNLFQPVGRVAAFLRGLNRTASHGRDASEVPPALASPQLAVSPGWL